MYAIRATRLSRRFGAKEALQELNLEVRAGECLGLLGHNGAGKTTTLKLLLGLMKPSSGQAEVLGHPAGHRSIRNRVGYSPETPHFYPFLTARESLDFYRKLAGLRPRQVDLDAILTTVGLAGASNSRVGGFSKGMVQRLAVAQALVGDPEVLFLDEPSSGLDPAGRVEMRGLIRQLRSKGKTIILNTHILADVEMLADRVIMLKAGRLAGVIDQHQGSQIGAVARVEQMRPEMLAGLRQMGLAASLEGEKLVIAGIAPGQEPEVAAYLVTEGARLYSFMPQQQSLEEQFLEVMEGGASHVGLDSERHA